ncbi:MAG: carbamoyl-phosphate synthase small subunit [Candidatus Peribacteria bacterium]|nr:carbamoyl-phosphate synthase small subunit [Candidatus Peribacteria bacterium]
MPSLILSDGTVFSGQSFGARVDTDGEVVFSTGMVGYNESVTDPSFRGQILVFTYPLIGNYGVPTEEKNEHGFSRNFESENIHVRGVIVAQYSEQHSHHNAVSSFGNWLEKHNIPGITGIDTRALTKKLREHGVMLGRIVQDTPTTNDIVGKIEDPNLRNLVAEVSCNDVIIYEPTLSTDSGQADKRTNEPTNEPLTIIAYDCGMKRNIIRSFLKRGVRVVRVPWNFDLTLYTEPYDGVFFSNGPGDPKMCVATIAQLKYAIDKNIPTWGICLGNQLMALAIGGDTYKLKYGHRGLNQPCIEELLPNAKEPLASHLSAIALEATAEDSKLKTQHCIITSQNHGFAVQEDSLPAGWHVWFRNANDGTVEGLRHESGRFSSIQFHPEATPGPEDADYLFDEFVHLLEQERSKTDGK